MSLLTTEDVYNACQDTGSQEEQLKCIVDQLVQQDHYIEDFISSMLLVYSAALVFFMQAGFAMVCAGAVRKKNVQNTMLKNLLDAVSWTTRNISLLFRCTNFWCVQFYLFPRFSPHHSEFIGLSLVRGSIQFLFRYTIV
jgi:hypothetical protein